MVVTRRSVQLLLLQEPSNLVIHQQTQDAINRPLALCRSYVLVGGALASLWARHIVEDRRLQNCLVSWYAEARYLICFALCDHRYLNGTYLCKHGEG